MCGRFALNTTEAALKAHFHLTSGLVIQPRYNIPPSLSIPMIKTWQNGIDFAQWGFVPSWYKTADPTHTAAIKPHINARVESVSQKPTFKTDFQKRRCLIPATGYFEWREWNGKKQPYYISLINQPLFAFAGIWSTWDTCAILTNEAPAFMQSLHERMPVIIAPSHYEAWLQHKRVPDIASCFLALTQENTRAYAVSPRMNNPQFDEALCIQPLST